MNAGHTEQESHSERQSLQQAADDLRDVLNQEGLAEPNQAAATIAAALPASQPLLFQSGLCAGYPLTPAPREFFVAQEFSADRADLFSALSAAFQSFDLKPYRADQDILPGHILCKIAAKLQTTLFGVSVVYSKLKQGEATSRLSR